MLVVAAIVPSSPYADTVGASTDRSPGPSVREPAAAPSTRPATRPAARPAAGSATALRAAAIRRHLTSGAVVLPEVSRPRSVARALRHRTRRLPTGARVLLPWTRSHASTPEQILASVARAELTVVATAPYGLLLGGGDPDLAPLAAVERTHAWRRLLSWLPEDPLLAALVELLERTLVPRLPLGATRHALLVLERHPSLPGGPGPREQRLRLAPAAALASIPPEELAAPLTSPRARYLMFTLLAQLESRGPDQAAQSDHAGAVLPPPYAAEYAEWRAAHAADAGATALTRAWARDCEGRLRRGVDLTLAADYQLVGDLLSHHYRSFPEDT